MPSFAAAWVRDPFASIASSSAILPGPREQRGPKSTRNLTSCIRLSSLRYAVYAMRGSTDNRVMQLLGWSAAACWCVAWFLPVVEGYAGWAAFRAALEAPFRHSIAMRGEDLVPQLLSALTNVVFVVLFANWQRGQVTRPALFLKVAIACLLLNLYWLVEMLRAGERD